jgi:hypothetical protein
MSDEIKNNEEMQIETGWDKTINVFEKIGKGFNAIKKFFWNYEYEISSVFSVIFCIVVFGAVLWGIVSIFNANYEYTAEKQVVAVAQESAQELYNYTFEITGKSVEEGRYFFTYTYYYTYNNETVYVDEIVEVSESIFDSAVVGDSINIKTLEVTSQTVEETTFSYFDN